MVKIWSVLYGVSILRKTTWHLANGTKSRGSGLPAIVETGRRNSANDKKDSLTIYISRRPDSERVSNVRYHLVTKA
ncbi:hypothetical protein NQ317_015630 [Molorchus minor]|uniref:Uncharacterized protein n=1 Tax=Molorchus minor TaxID=1323400 RepID=A0ABQ9JVQ2_9CUCU|nr:hypothetical protein NQ317_015630 [Molorchus minor]